MLRAYKYRIYPTDDQIVLINKHFGCVRFIYNFSLGLKIKAIENNESLNCFTVMKFFPAMKKDPKTEWLKEVNSQSLQVAAINVDTAFKNFYRSHKGFPKFKSKKDNRKSFNIPSGIEVEFDKNLVSIPKFKDPIKTILHREFKGKIKQATISKTPTNKYFISILVDTEQVAIVKQPVQESTTVGLDMGIHTYIVCSNGKKFDNPKFLKQSLKRLKILQKRASRKVKGSKNRAKANLKVSLLYEHITNQRLDYMHKTTHWLTHQEDIQTICVETLDIIDMMKKDKDMARCISDVSWSATMNILKYKSDWYGKNHIEIGQFDASSKICNICGYYYKDLTLDMREWDCPDCKSHHDRDENASVNIKKFGLSKYSGQAPPVVSGESSTLNS